jgi:ubiquinone/menaquinone biosynthesis C-methylase UbiE
MQPEFDFLDLHTFGDNTFDAVASDQVLEHVEGDPFVAIAESVRVVKAGGFVVHTTCFLNSLHGAPTTTGGFRKIA